MTSDQIESERVRFEAWFASNWHDDFGTNSRDGTYDQPTVEWAWMGWLARAEEQYAERGHDDE